jgi:hypothetical protein
MEVFSRVRLTVAPLCFDAEIKGKVLESFAAGSPCAMPVAAKTSEQRVQEAMATITEGGLDQNSPSNSSSSSTSFIAASIHSAIGAQARMWSLEAWPNPCRPMR